MAVDNKLYIIIIHESTIILEVCTSHFVVFGFHAIASIDIINASL